MRRKRIKGAGFARRFFVRAPVLPVDLRVLAQGLPALSFSGHAVLPAYCVYWR